MRFIHMADMHLDASFSNLSDKENIAQKLRIKQRDVLKKIVEYIKEQKIKYFFIAGDFFEGKNAKLSTAKYINDLFLQIPFCKIFIVPGNHDPLIENSIYKSFKFASNVKIFSKQIERIQIFDEDSDENINIYGFGFEDYYQNSVDLTKLSINTNLINIFFTHTCLNVYDCNKPYNPINTKVLDNLDFDYIALGHIHKKDLDSKYVYPGSCNPLGFDELGDHGILDVTLEKNMLNKTTVEKEFVVFKEYSFKIEQIDISEIYDIEQLAQKLNEIVVDEYEFLKIELIGFRNFEIDLISLYNLIDNDNIIKIKDLSKIKQDVNELKNEKSLKGIFFTKLDELELNDEEKEQLLQIGLDLFNL